MTNCIFYSLIFVLFLNFTSGAICYSKIDRNFTLLYRGLFEASSITIDKNGNYIYPYYDETVLEDYLQNYFKESIKKYTTDYSIKIYYFDRENNNYCTDHFCKDINITLTAKINFLFKYEKSKNFSIMSRNEL